LSTKQKRWNADITPDAQGLIHIWPDADLNPHLLHGTNCDCDPKIQKVSEKSGLVIHRSYDMRELKD
jgi:hypothetical protein